MPYIDAHQLDKLDEMLLAGNWDAAKRYCEQTRDRAPDNPVGWHLMAELLVRAGQVADSVAFAQRTVDLSRRDPQSLALAARSHVLVGETEQALQLADESVTGEPFDPASLDTLGNVYSRCHRDEQALAMFERAVALAPGNATYLYNLATSYRFFGKTAQAESAFNQVVEINPHDYQAVLSRSLLRDQRAEDNHVDELERHLRSDEMSLQCQIHYRFALAKELEDMAEYQASFAHLSKGTAIKRESINYDLSRDLDDMAHLAQQFRSPVEPEPVSQSARSPIFVLGLPRSGTTLVERILSSHPMLQSAGEIRSFPNALEQVSTGQAPLDYSALGQTYLARAARFNPAGGRFIDKLPLNYLNIGHIVRALPAARIVLLERDLMDACYAMFKTLFEGNAYGFSYDQDELARYLVGYLEMMKHWQSIDDGQIQVVRYEQLVKNPEPEVGKLLEFCGLPWDEACLSFPDNPSASTTQSASQVRKPIYTSSVEAWKRFEPELAPAWRILNASDML